MIRAPALMAAGLVVLAAWWWRQQQAAPEVGDMASDETGNAGDLPEPDAYDPAAVDVAGLFSNLTGAAVETVTATDNDQAAANVAAFLRMIRVAEGTAGPDGYRTLFGGGLFAGFADHPRIARQFRDRAGRLLWTSAAGAYQFMAASPLPGGGSTRVDTWGELKRRLQLPDFSPASQDAAAVELIRQAGALYDVRAGRFADAVAKVRRIWASMPGAGYDQAEQSMGRLQAAYTAAGGALA